MRWKNVRSMPTMIFSWSVRTWIPFFDRELYWLFFGNFNAKKFMLVENGAKWTMRPKIWISQMSARHKPPQPNFDAQKFSRREVECIRAISLTQINIFEFFWCIARRKNAEHPPIDIFEECMGTFCFESHFWRHKRFIFCVGNAETAFGTRRSEIFEENVSHHFFVKKKFGDNGSHSQFKFPNQS